MQTIQKIFEETEAAVVREGSHLVRHSETGFHLSPELREKYELVLAYFHGHESFRQYRKGFSLNKGLLICGSVGTGKTLMMLIYSRLVFNAHGKQHVKMFEITDSHTIVREFLQNGFEVIDQYSTKHYFRNGEPKGLCIDDIGMEDQHAVSYGNRANVIEQILYERYKRMRFDGMTTHATTNCPPSKLGELYGPRIADRMVEMFNVIEVNGKSLRS